jgi:hypothetical protein
MKVSTTECIFCGDAIVLGILYTSLREELHHMQYSIYLEFRDNHCLAALSGKIVHFGGPNNQWKPWHIACEKCFQMYSTPKPFRTIRQRELTGRSIVPKRSHENRHQIELQQREFEILYKASTSSLR